MGAEVRRPTGLRHCHAGTTYLQYILDLQTDVSYLLQYASVSSLASATITIQNGFEDTFTATAMGALEVGAMPYARGLIDHQWDHSCPGRGGEGYPKINKHMKK